ncbi:hypothetical protein BJI67_02330 [Acidihalobacter aeolianus]|uniref:N-acetyltransferase domain-containing protein n=2 Tax=Acidihalobacter aeolianus TaxID=2792603 RepID=A0A1D8K527_9GAMM|nr:hypothetical protein BJI67_02330 [Acidihalobacter aeolianus]
MQTESLIVRPARESDVPSMHEIYRHYVETTIVSFEETAPDLDDFAARLCKYRNGWACVVAELGGKVLGYAYGGPHRERAAYRWSVEMTIYVAPGLQRQGVGRGLYRVLLPMLADAGYCNAYAGIALPNPGSVGLHRAVGFTPIGTFPREGHKFGRWHDVMWFHLPLRESPPD